MKTTFKVCTVLNHIDECEAFWTVMQVPARPDGARISGLTVGVGDTEEAAIADFKTRTGIDAADVEVEIVVRDNVNIEMYDGEGWTTDDARQAVTA